MPWDNSKLRALVVQDKWAARLHAGASFDILFIDPGPSRKGSCNFHSDCDDGELPKTELINYDY